MSAFNMSVAVVPKYGLVGRHPAHRAALRMHLIC